MHCYQLALQITLSVVSPYDDLTGSSFVEINPKRPDLLCARSLIDSDSVIGIVTSLFLICVLPHGHARGPVVH